MDQCQIVLHCVQSIECWVRIIVQKALLVKRVLAIDVHTDNVAGLSRGSIDQLGVGIHGGRVRCVDCVRDTVSIKEWILWIDAIVVGDVREIRCGNDVRCHERGDGNSRGQGRIHQALLSSSACDRDDVVIQIANLVVIHSAISANLGIHIGNERCTVSDRVGEIVVSSSRPQELMLSMQCNWAG